METISHLSKDHGCGQIDLSFKFDRKSVIINETPFGLQVNLENCQPSSELGGPSLPSKIVRVALPPAMQVLKLQAQCPEHEALTSEPVLVAPLQPARAGSKEKSPSKDKDKPSRKPTKQTEAVTRIDPERLAHLDEPLLVEPQPAPDFIAPVVELYEQEIKQPRPLAQVVTTEQIGLNPVVVVQLNPIRFNKKGQLEFCSNIDIALTYTPQTAVSITDEDQKIAPTVAQPMLRQINSKQQALRYTEISRSLVVNTDMIVDLSEFLAPLITEADYLIITDNQRWNADSITPVGTVSGNMVAEFQKLAKWKRRRGLKAEVVTVTNIVNNRYGNFKSGARDLQEVIRNFMKHAYQDWGVAWCLIGGDIEVVPVRKVAGLGNSALGKETDDPPKKNRCFWTGSFMKLYAPGTSTSDGLLNASSGLAIPYDSTGSSSSTQRGWYYCTDNNYNIRTTSATDYIRINGPSAQINANILRVNNDNLIPTDLYYASLVGPSYNQPGLHDWDLVNNGWYGTHTDALDSDGVEYQADVSVGRAPASNASEAEAFVKKIIAYESFERPDGSSLDVNWTRKMLLGSSNWGGRVGIIQTSVSPPTDKRYYHASGASDTLIKLKDAFDNMNWRLLAVVSDTDIRTIPYNRSANATHRGWHYVKSATDMSVSEVTISIIGITFHFPIPTEWVRVFSTSDELTPSRYIFDSTSADGSMLDQEQLREQVDSELSGITQFYRLYEDEMDLTAAQKAAAPYAHLTEQRMLDKINQGYHFVSLSGHGNWNGCCGYTVNTAQNASNGYHGYIAYADSCLTNKFDYSDAASEESVINANGGAVAYIGNSRFSWIGVGDNFQRGFFHHLTNTRHVGLANDIRCAMINESTGFYKRYNKWAIFALNLMGDPEMPLWIGPPRTMIASYKHDLDKREPFTVKVEYVGIFGLRFPLANAVVALQQGNKLLVKKTSFTGYVSFDINGLELGDVDLTISKIGYKPITETIEIVGPLWVNGKVALIHHQYQKNDQTYVRLNLSTPIDGDSVRGWLADRDRPDYRILLDAVTDAYISKENIQLLVNNKKELGGIEAFRFARLPMVKVPSDKLALTEKPVFSSEVSSPVLIATEANEDVAETAPTMETEVET